MAASTAVPNTTEMESMKSNPSISLSPPTQARSTLSPPGRSSRPNSQVISPAALNTGRLAGNKSPNSIPSSPTSVHSSSSAIFERDIEQLASPHHSLRDPHHTSRAMAHELDDAVPSVLTSAISALNVGSDEDAISVIAPAQLHKSRFGHSRSPSPTGRPLFGDRQSTGPYPPGGFPTHSHSNAPSPPATDVSPALSPNVTGTSPPNNGATSPSSPLSPTTPPLPTARPRPRKSNPQLNTDTAQNRLSFMSYHDLLASTPLASVPLSSIVRGDGEPGHLPGVIGMHGHGSIGGLGANEGEGGDIGGEFDREGLGKGLEERLEGVLNEGRA